MKSLNDLLSYREVDHPMFGTYYRAVIIGLENDLIKTSSNYVASRINDYDNEAQALLYYQLKEMDRITPVNLEIDSLFKKVENFDLSSVSEDKLTYIKSEVHDPVFVNETPIVKMINESKKNK